MERHFLKFVQSQQLLSPSVYTDWSNGTRDLVVCLKFESLENAFEATRAIPAWFSLQCSCTECTHATNLKLRKQFFHETFDHQQRERAKNFENVTLQTAKDLEVIRVYPLTLE